MFVAAIDLDDFVGITLPIQFSDVLVRLRGLMHPSTSTMVFPMTEVGAKFRIGGVQASEWLAVSSIPPECISQLHFD